MYTNSTRENSTMNKVWQKQRLANKSLQSTYLVDF